ncbi:PREDICTED: probable LRR receptor-like serine/threonine-protein kinase MEE39 [Camelina sativa]|uniref:Probable LRR receptor-like serine/threonine-protein kinase MEE39 n=1 Tax=Camelina sativa TaxID=90675 RepID=A0ABM1R642_CAMSA|nr:PREDICTED: probable LRR receptor-like serine/threonine-protein kinase MEE39 [Camelina sativa]
MQGERYLIRTTFLHGGFDNNSTKRFELHLGVNPWTTVSTVNETEQIVFEMIHLLTTDRLQVCLVKTGDPTPFITGLELRKLNTKPTALQQDPCRLSCEQTYREDVFDRIWMPYNSEKWSQISTHNSVGVYNEYKPPETAMITASVPTDLDASLNISPSVG